MSNDRILTLALHDATDRSHARSINSTHLPREKLSASCRCQDQRSTSRRKQLSSRRMEHSQSTQVGKRDRDGRCAHPPRVWAVIFVLGLLSAAPGRAAQSEAITV